MMRRKTAHPPVRHTTRGERTRLRITQTAADLIHRQGFRHTSLDDILLAAQVPKGSLYFYFRNKDELGVAIIRHQREMLLEVLDKIFTQTGPLSQHIADWFRFMESTQQTAGGFCGCPVGNLAQELSHEDTMFAEEIDQFFLHAQEIIATRLQRAQDGGELGVDIPPEEIARFLLMASQGALLLTKTRRSMEPLHEAHQTVVRFLDSFAARKKKRRSAATQTVSA